MPENQGGQPEGQPQQTGNGQKRSRGGQKFRIGTPTPGREPVRETADDTELELPYEDGDELLVVNTSSENELTVTVEAQTPCNHGFFHDWEDTVSPGGKRVLGPFERPRAGQMLNVVLSHADAEYEVV